MPGLGEAVLKAGLDNSEAPAGKTPPRTVSSPEIRLVEALLLHLKRFEEACSAKIEADPLLFTLMGLAHDLSKSDGHSPTHQWVSMLMKSLSLRFEQPHSLPELLRELCRGRRPVGEKTLEALGEWLFVRRDRWNRSAALSCGETAGNQLEKWIQEAIVAVPLDKPEGFRWIELAKRVQTKHACGISLKKLYAQIYNAYYNLPHKNPEIKTPADFIGHYREKGGCPALTQEQKRMILCYHPERRSLQCAALRYDLVSQLAQLPPGCDSQPAVAKHLGIGQNTLSCLLQPLLKEWGVETLRELRVAHAARMGRAYLPPPPPKRKSPVWRPDQDVLVKAVLALKKPTQQALAKCFGASQVAAGSWLERYFGERDLRKIRERLQAELSPLTPL